jgi:ketosteroid isomerase-like protein
MDPLSRLVAIEDIKRLKARYARFFDAERWSDFADLFTEDAVLAHPHLGTVTGPHEIVGAVSAGTANGTFSHHVGMAEIDVLDENLARGVWSVIVQGQRHDSVGDWVDDGRSEYHEEYRKSPDGRWRISASRTIPMTRISRIVPPNTPLIPNESRDP